MSKQNESAAPITGQRHEAIPSEIIEIAPLVVAGEPSLAEALASGSDSLLSVKDAATLVCVSESMIYKWIELEKLSDIRVGTKRVIRKSEVLKQLQVA